MKTVTALFVVIMLFGACSTPKKTVPKRDRPKITHADVLKGGTSFSNPIVTMMQSEREVLDEEYKWLSVNYPGYSLVKRTFKLKSSKHYDIVRIKTNQGQLRDIYFDSTQFWGKN
jgi:predicted RNA-binding protein associated with RNAse of E/G family